MTDVPGNGKAAWGFDEEIVPADDGSGDRGDGRESDKQQRLKKVDLQDLLKVDPEGTYYQNYTKD